MTTDSSQPGPHTPVESVTETAAPTHHAPKITASAYVRLALMHPYTTVSFVTLLVMGIGAVLKRNPPEWDAVYVGAARALARGQDIYHGLIGYTYPPFSAWAMLPFTLLPMRLGRAIWYLICVVSLVYMIKVSWRLAGGSRVEPLSNPVARRRREQVAFLIGHAIALQLTLNALTHLQTDLLIGAMLTAGCVAIVGGKFLRAATWIGAAAAFKATPLLFAPYLLWRRQWAAACWLVVVAVGANMLPDTVHRPPRGSLWLSNWYHQYLQPMTESNYVPGAWQNKLNNNQALAGAASRWLLSTWTTHPEDPAPDTLPRSKSKISDDPTEEAGVSHQGSIVIPRLHHPGTGAVRALFAGSCLAVLIPATWVMWRRRRPGEWGRESAPAGKNEYASVGSIQSDAVPTQTVLECGIIMLLMVLLSPNSSRAHFCVMYLAAFCVGRIAVRPGASIWLRIFLAAAVIASTLSIHVRLPGTEVAEQILLWIGVVMLATVFLLIAAIIALYQGKESTLTNADAAPI